MEGLKIHQNVHHLILASFLLKGRTTIEADLKAFLCE